MMLVWRSAQSRSSFRQSVLLTKEVTTSDNIAHPFTCPGLLVPMEASDILSFFEEGDDKMFKMPLHACSLALFNNSNEYPRVN